jgi:hypothetical protein
MRIVLIGLALLPLAALSATPATAEPPLTLVFTDRSGAPAARAEAVLVNTDTGYVEQVTSDNGTATVPAGRYAAFVKIHTGDTEASLLAWPRLTGVTTAAFDARVARPIDVRVPERTATVAAAVVNAALTFQLDGETREVGDAVSHLDAEQLSTAHLGPPTPGFHAGVKVDMAEPDVSTSPYLYSLYWQQDDQMFTGLRRHLTDRRGLTTNQASYAQLGGPAEAHTVTLVDGDMAIGTPISLPHTRTEYYSAGIDWTAQLCYGPGGDQEPFTCLSGKPGPSWNEGPFLPAATLIERLGDRLRIVPAIVDQAGHPGLARTDLDGTLTLYRDGAVVDTTTLDRPGFTGLPPEVADYRLELIGTVATLLPGSRFRAAWTFASGYAPIGEGKLPALSVRLTPDLDPTNQAPAGRPLTLPVQASAGVRTATVAVSFDAGATWHQLRLRPTTRGWTTTVTPPPGATDISFRTTAADADGNTVEQELTHAIRLREPADQP